MDRAEVVGQPRRVGEPLRVGRPDRLPLVAEWIPVALLVDLHRLALLDVDVPDAHVGVDERDLLRVGRPPRPAIEARLGHRDLDDVADAGLRRDVQRVLARFVGEVRNRSSVGRPGGRALHHLRRVGDVSRIALFGGHRDDLAARLEQRARRVGRQMRAGQTRAHVHHPRAHLRQIARDLHRHLLHLTRLQIEQRESAELLDRNRVGPGADRLEVEAVVLDLLLHLARPRVVGIERHGTVAIAQEVHLRADPQRVVVVRVVARHFLDRRVGERRQPDRRGVAAAIALPHAERAPHRHIGEPAAVGRIRRFPAPRQRQPLGEGAVRVHRVELLHRRVAVAIRREQDPLAVRRPRQHGVRRGMPCEPLRHATRRGHRIDVGVAVVLAGEGDGRSVRRVDRVGLDARAAGEPLRGAAVARHRPEIAGIHERDVRAAQRRLLEQQRREGIGAHYSEAADR